MAAEQKQLGLFSIVAITVSGIIGSGWLFSAYLGAKAAGAGVYVSWTLTLGLFLLMALAISEVIALFPLPGLVGRMGVVSHNRFFGAIFSFAIWLELVGSMPGEAQASVEYLASLSPKISALLMEGESLTVPGLAVTLGFLAMYWLINMFGLRFFARVNNAVAIYKLVVPVVTALVVMAVAFDTSNFEAYQGAFLPYGPESIVAAITTAGMIYAFNGFQLATAFAAEVRDPAKTIPRGIILGLLVCFAIYVLLQTAFIGALGHDGLVHQGWRGLSFASPFVQLTTALGLNFLTLVLYSDACISPGGTGITFVGTATRVLYGMAVEKQMPSFLGRLGSLDLRPSLAFNFAVALVLLFLFHSWAALILFMTGLIVLMYMVIPLAVIGMRRAFPNAERPFRLRGATPLCALLFMLQSMILPFIGAGDVLALSVVCTLFMFVFMVVNIPRHHEYTFADIASVSLPFLVFLWLLTAAVVLGPAEYGGRELIGSGAMFIWIGILSLAAFAFLTSHWFVERCQVMRRVDERRAA